MNITNIKGTVAIPLSDQKLLLRNSCSGKISFIGGKVEESKIGEFLSDLESKITCETDDLSSLKYSILLLQDNHIMKEEYVARVNSLEKLYDIKNRVEHIKAELGSKFNAKAREMEIERLVSLLQTTYSCPLRAVLEEELNSLTEFNDSTLNTTNSIEYSISNIKEISNSLDLDELLCENMIEEYINIPTRERIHVANTLFRFKNELLSKEDIVKKINEVRKSQDFFVNQDKLEDDYKITIDVMDISKIRM
ncbi:hypothetical protein B6A27_08745 [Anoxybacillus sp. UARK-01]|uniref:hypothetical protein n=1 Tax=Anoxybacillus sp. UARK-01 TaxID=1895648 RepID=UPI0009BB75CE|nr:hypothetical protein [Anoxybacillus sp. UARK-01]OQM45976.1 hypothetical protein B6A27_08745 [Anoxybacillus sp. UARK-01]